MKIDTAKLITDFDGKPLEIGKDKKRLAVREVLKQALLETVMESDQKPLSGQAKFDNYKLAEKICLNDVVDFSVEELAMLKKLVGNMFIPVVVGAVWKILDGEGRVMIGN